MNYEFELAWPGTSAAMLLAEYGADNWQIPITVVNDHLLAIKESHKYKRNSPHFLKTMQDIHFLRFKVEPDWQGDEFTLEFFAVREKESYDYAHPKLNVTSKDFFTGDGVQYVYEHDSIHLAVALLEVPNLAGNINTPAYTFYMKDGSEVMTSKDKFFSVEDKVRLYGVYEESCVLALERSQIPHGLGKDGGPSARWSFEMALMKVCTSITSGFFREYAWENYNEVIDLYNELGEEDYIERFKRNQHLLKPYVG
ncbi:putative nucleotidyltransferase [Pseudomonas phage 16Q]|nr:putative nucleotidyltransferase [Pseudomonas phage 16Q]